jgi:hypothetical protein
MTIKFFNYQGAPWQIIETQDPWGKSLTIAVEMDSTHGAMLNTEEYSQGSDWEYVEATDVRIDEWFLKSDPNDLFIGDDEYDEQYEEKHDDSTHSFGAVDSGKLKRMLEGLRSSPDWDDMNRHERLKASLDQSGKNLNKAEDILGMIRARQANEMPPTVILNPSKYTDSKTLESALETIRKKDSEANIWVGTVPADDLLATLKNQETIGLSSVPDDSKPLGLMLDQETLDLIKKLGPKKR